MTLKHKQEDTVALEDVTKLQKANINFIYISCNC